MFQISIQLKNVVVDLLHQYFLDNNEGIYVPHKRITTPSPKKGIMALILETKVDMLRTKCSFQKFKYNTPANTAHSK